MGLVVSLSVLVLSTFVAPEPWGTESYDLPRAHGASDVACVMQAPLAGPLEQDERLEPGGVASPTTLPESVHGVNATSDVGEPEPVPSRWSWLALDPSLARAVPDRDPFGSGLAPRTTPALGVSLGVIKLSGSAQYDFRSRALGVGATLSVDI